MRLALDTNRYSDLCRGEEVVKEWVERATAVFLPFVVIAELRAGFLGGARSHENERTLQRLLAKPGVDILFATEVNTRTYARLYLQLREQGTPIPTNDIWIAALVEEHQLTLYSRDSHFRHLPQLPLLP